MLSVLHELIQLIHAIQLYKINDNASFNKKDVERVNHMFEIDLRSRDPIYQQLVDKFKQLIINHILEPDEKLPSVRQLAEEITVNPNTIQKAYRQLEQENFIYSVKGRGSFVQALESHVASEKVEEIKASIVQLVKEATFLGVKQSTIIEWVESDTEIEKEVNDL